MFSDPIQLVLLPVRRGRGPRVRRAADRRRLPDPPGHRRPGRSGSRCPGRPTQVELSPDLVFLLFLPPILFGAGFQRRSATSRQRAADRPARDRARAVHHGRGRVVAKCACPGACRSPPAFTLGAIVAPPDAVAATAVLRRLGRPAPRRHDPGGREPDQRRLGADRVQARDRGGHRHVLARRGGHVVRRRRPRRDRRRGRRRLARDQRAGGARATRPSRSSLSLLAPLTAYLSAEPLGRERGPRRRSPRGSSPAVRRPAPLARTAASRARACGTSSIFLINSFVFMLIGLQLPASSRGLSDWSAQELVLLGWACDSLAVIVARIVWVFPGDLPAAAAQREDPGARAGADAPERVRRGVGRHARRRLPGGRPRPATARLPAARPHHLPHVLRHRRDARRAGPDAAVADPPARIVSGGRGPRGGAGAAAAVAAALARLTTSRASSRTTARSIDQLRPGTARG